MARWYLAETSYLASKTEMRTIAWLNQISLLAIPHLKNKKIIILAYIIATLWQKLSRKCFPDYIYTHMHTIHLLTCLSTEAKESSKLFLT